MEILNHTNPPMDDQFLEHYGVLGMKWGVRKDRGSSSKKPKKVGAPSGRFNKERDLEIQIARQNTAYRQSKVKESIIKSNMLSGERHAREIAKVRKGMHEIVTNPDTVTAGYLTRGEVVAHTIVATAAPGVGTLVVAGLAAQRSAQRRSLQRARQGS